MRRPTAWVAGVLLVAAALAHGGEGDGRGPAGFWRGEIAGEEGPVDVMIEIRRAGTVWEARAFMPTQGIRDARMERVHIEGRELRFRIAEVPGFPTFQGTLGPDGQNIEGTFTQAGNAYPFILGRDVKPPELSRDVYAAYGVPGEPGTGLQGHWRGLLELGPHRMGLVVTLSRDGAGQWSGVVRSPEEGATHVPVAGVRFVEGSVRIEMPSIGAAFGGKMKPDGSAIVGFWTQGGERIPLTFHRGDVKP